MPSRPIAPGTAGLKFLPATFFGLKVPGLENFWRESKKILKNFGLKVENFKKSWRENKKKRCQLAN
jgi:hypothetical protein